MEKGEIREIGMGGRSRSRSVAQAGDFREIAVPSWRRCAFCKNGDGAISLLRLACGTTTQSGKGWDSRDLGGNEIFARFGGSRTHMRRREGARSLRDGARWNGLDGRNFWMGRVGGRELVRGRPCAECRAGQGARWVFLSRGFCTRARDFASCEIILTGAEPAAARHERSYLFCGAPPARHRLRVALHLGGELAAVTPGAAARSRTSSLLLQS